MNESRASSRPKMLTEIHPAMVRRAAAVLTERLVLFLNLFDAASSSHGHTLPIAEYTELKA